MHRFWIVAAAAVVLIGTTAVAASYQPGVQVGSVPAEQITEASGLAASWRNSGVLWTHNDSGDSARVFALSTTGSLLGTYNLTGAGAFDWEDMAVGPGPSSGISYLFMGDIGDNAVARSTIQVYRVPEPLVSGPPATVNLGGVDTITLTYPDSAHNAETLIADPLTGDLYIVTKSLSGTEKVYRTPAPAAGSSSINLQFLTSINIILATGGSVAPDGSALIVRNLIQGFQFTTPPGGTLADAFSQASQPVSLQLEEQGESLGFMAPGSPLGFYTLSEGLNQPLWYYAAVPEPMGIGWVLAVAWSLKRPRRRR